MSTTTTTPPEDPTGEYPAIAERAPRVSVAFGGATHAGRVRPKNEDQFLIAKLAKSMRICASSLNESETTRFSDEEGYLMIVADGMGGVAGGQEASAMAVRTVERFVLDVIQWFLHREGQEQEALRAELRQALQRADREIVERADLEPRLNGMGTTLTLSYSVGGDLFLAHAGDSRGYLFHDGRLERVTSDHTLVQLLIDEGAISEEDAREHPRRHVITNVVGGPDEGVRVEIHRRSLRDGDVLLLCTDGLTSELTDTEIARLISENPDPGQCAQRLIDAALAEGARDNVTVALARYSISSNQSA
ncbi:MAG: PP2C family serine/threonine-protein phosphatase [Isosphaeraceae bacterium]